MKLGKKKSKTSGKLYVNPSSKSSRSATFWIIPKLDDQCESCRKSFEH